MPGIQESGSNSKINMRCLQLNLNHCQAAHDLLKQSVLEKQIDVALLSEPYKIVEGANWTCDSRNKAAIWKCNPNSPQLENPYPSNGFVRATISDVNIYSCYLPPSINDEEFKNIIDCLVTDARSKTNLVIAGDFNAWAIEWGCKRTNSRGKALLEAFASLDLVLLNTNQPTFNKIGRQSVIDLTFVKSNLVRRSKWKISDHYTFSDHYAIIFEINVAHIRQNVPTLVRCSWRTKTFDPDLFEETFRPTVLQENPLSANSSASIIMTHLKKACDASMSKHTRRNHHPPVYWWNDTIDKLRKACQQARRSYQRSRGTPDHIPLQRLFKDKRKLLKQSIKKSKRECFLKLCDDVEDNAWGLAYKVVMAKLRSRGQMPTSPPMLERIVSVLFPTRPLHSQLHQAIIEVAPDIPSVTNEEVREACDRLNPSKAPGPDGIPNLALKTAISKNTDPFRIMYDTCIKEGCFPKLWKKQHLILLPKPNKPLTDPSHFRPLCMLDSAGKILERIVYRRLNKAIDDAGGLSPNQFGFRKARSTIDAVTLVKTLAEKAISGKRWKGGTIQYCMVVTLDVKNAFNSASWYSILTALKSFSVPPYL